MDQKMIYITGHKGLVGSNVLKQFPNALITEVDLRDYDEIEIIFKNNDIDVVINCAGKVGGIQANIDNNYIFFNDNLKIQSNIIDLCLKYKVKKCVILGSSCIYPANYDRKLRENDLLSGYPEKTNEGYSIAKICGLKMAEYANKVGDTHFISLMPCNLYGSGEKFDLKNSHVMSALIKKIIDARDNNDEMVEVWGSGKAKREFLYIDDLVDCIEWSLVNVGKDEGFLNVGTGDDIRIRDLAYLIKSLSGYEGDFYFDTTKPEGMMRKCLDVSEINKLGWRHKIDLVTGIKMMIDYYVNLKNES